MVGSGADMDMVSDLVSGAEGIFTDPQTRNNLLVQGEGYISLPV